MSYNYTPDDLIYDIESLENIFTNAQWYPNKDTNTLVISYIDDDNIIKSKEDLKIMEDRIRTVNPALQENNTKIVFEDLTNYANLTKFVKRFGFATYETWNNFIRDDGHLNIRTNAGGQGSKSYNSPFDLPVRKPFNNQNGYFKLEETQYQKAFDALKDGDKYNALASGKVHPSDPTLRTPSLLNSEYYPVKQTDPQYNKNAVNQGLRLGFNSTNYDLTLLALQFNVDGNRELFRKGSKELNELFQAYQDVNSPRHEMAKKFFDDMNQIIKDNWTAENIRRLNNQLFTKYKGKMTDSLRDEEQVEGKNYTRSVPNDAFYTHKGWLQTNRFYDIAQFNAHMTKVSLKRLSAFKLLQVKESDKLSQNSDIINSVDEFAELLAYNISDVINTKALFEDIAYQDTLKLHQELLNRFPELIYESKEDIKHNPSIIEQNHNALYEPLIQSDNLVYTRVTADSTSAKFVQKVIAPYLALNDNKAIDYHYPDAQILKEVQAGNNVPEVVKAIKEPYDVLEATKAWVEEQDRKHFGDKTPIWDQFKYIYEAYKSLRGANINDQLQDKEVPKAINVNERMKQFDTSIFYIGPDGKKSASMVNFSIGGIHGAEINQDKYDNDRAEWNEKVKEQQIIKDYYHDDAVLTHHDREIEIDGKIYEPRKSLKSGSTNSHAEWRDLTKSEPKIFDAAGKVKKKYAYVSVGQANHEDFSSFYPLLLSMLAVFRDEFGKDRYYDLYKERLALKAKLKTLDSDSEEYTEANMAQLVRKLLLNSASGQADAKFFNNIRKNNATVSMRIIGQLFAWRIGQAEALAGARVPSTNTDGLYTMGIEPAINDKVLAKTIEPMMIDVDPEIVHRFVSKDSNNRIEVEGKTDEDSKVSEAKGGTLTSWNGPGVTNNLDHPAISDMVLAQYMAKEQDPANRDFDRNRAMKYMQPIIEDLQSEDIETSTKALGYFQWIIVSGLSTHRYPYVEQQFKDDDGNFQNPSNDNEYVKYIHAIPHSNRVFLIKTPEDATIRDTLKLATRAKVQKNQKIKDPMDVIKENYVLNLYGYSIEDESVPYNPSIQKIKDMPNDQNILINNHELYRVSHEDKIQLAQQLDYEGYMDMIEAKFNKNWRNE